MEYSHNELYYCPNGLKNIFEEKCFLDIKYTNNEEIINNIDYEKYKNKKTVVICLIDESRIKKKSDIFFFGRESLLDLISKNPIEWWIFNQSCFIDNDIITDYENNCYFINSQSLASMELGIKIALNFDKVSELSNINKTYFLESVKRSKKLPGLFVGNGVSIPFGSDPWDVLSNSLLDYLHPLYATNKNQLANKLGKNSISLADIVKETIDTDKYKSALYNGIYRKYESKMHTDQTMIRAIAKYKINHLNLK